MIERYKELRKTWLDTDNLIARFQTAVDELENSGAAAREEDRWSGDSDISGKTLDISAEMQNIAIWLERRMAYLDANIFVRFPAMDGDVNGDSECNISDVVRLISHCLGQQQVTIEYGDIDGNDNIDINDVVALINILLGVTTPN